MTGNTLLTSLGKFESLTGIGEELEIVDNPYLALDAAAFAKLGEICGAVTLSAFGPFSRNPNAQDVFAHLGWDTSKDAVNFATLRDVLRRDLAPVFPYDFDTTVLQPLINFLPIESITHVQGRQGLLIDFRVVTITGRNTLTSLKSFALLETITADLVIKNAEQVEATDLTFPKLADVGGDIYVPYKFKRVEVFPKFYAAATTGGGFENATAAPGTSASSSSDCAAEFKAVYDYSVDKYGVWTGSTGESSRMDALQLCCTDCLNTGRGICPSRDFGRGKNTLQFRL